MRSRVDVLIVGAGPAGLALANCFNGSPLTVRILEKRPIKTRGGRADGLKYLTLEIFDTLGLYDHVMSEACRHEEICHYNAGSDGILRREAVVPDIVPGLDEPREVTLAQDKVEQYLEDNLTKHGSIKVERGRVPAGLTIDDQSVSNSKAYPITVAVSHASAKPVDGPASLSNGHFDRVPEPEVIEAKYVVGCDGANSWTRKQVDIGVHLEGTDSIWGVIDIVPKTNFPDIRKACTIRSASSGSMLLEPREGRLVRFYVHLEDLPTNMGSDFDKSTTSPEKIAKIARNIIAPYTLDYDILEWWSAYHVKQQVAEKLSVLNRVFIAGDAVHLHSPKAGQGMNASIQDSFNLGWKIRACLEGACDHKILSTYDLERKPVAHALIDFDRAYVPLFSKEAPPTPADGLPNRSSNRFVAAYVQALKDSTGINIRYEPSLLTNNQVTSDYQPLAKNILVGTRLRNVKVINQSDGVATRVQKLITPTGVFRLLVFPGDISIPHLFSRLQRLGEAVTLPRPSRDNVSLRDAQLEILTIHAAKRVDVNLLDLHEAFHPWSEDGGWDYWKVYADDSAWHEGECRVYETLGVAKEEGCMVLMRPDGYVAMVVEMGDVGRVSEFLERVLVRGVEW